MEEGEERAEDALLLRRLDANGTHRHDHLGESLGVVDRRHLDQPLCEVRAVLGLAKLKVLDLSGG